MGICLESEKWLGKMLRKVTKTVLIGCLLIIVLVYVTWCSMHKPGQRAMHPLQQHLERATQEMASLDFNIPTLVTPSMQAYLTYYHLNFDDIEYKHVFGTFRSGEYMLAAHIFSPCNPQGTVFVLHGYIDHTGMLSHLIRYCLKQGFVAAVYDLPGHGLSSGKRISIESFSDYVTVFNDFVKLCEPHVPQPYHLISHSMGSAIVLEYLVHTEGQQFERIIFLAPLVRHVHWYSAKVMYFLGKLVSIKTVPRRYSLISSDPEFLEFVRNDPLQPDKVPVEWIGALYEWERQIGKVSPISHAVLIIQGTHDTVVDEKYNIPFLQQKIEGVTVKWIKNARHQLLNENPVIRAEVFNTINTYLKNNPKF